MKYVSDKEIFDFMKSSFMQEKIIALCTESFTKKTGHINSLKWNILKEFTTILKGNMTSFKYEQRSSVSCSFTSGKRLYIVLKVKYLCFFPSFPHFSDSKGQMEVE